MKTANWKCWARFKNGAIGCPKEGVALDLNVRYTVCKDHAKGRESLWCGETKDLRELARRLGRGTS